MKITLHQPILLIKNQQKTRKQIDKMEAFKEGSQAKKGNTFTPY
jgi:hypothetical protein